MRRSFDAWRDRARMLLACGTRPEQAVWEAWAGVGALFGEGHEGAARVEPPSPQSYRVPARVIDLLELVSCHRDPRRYALMYRLLWRITRGEHLLLEDAADDDVVTLTRMGKAVSRASHKMTAFVRFRELAGAGGPRYIARFEPEHDVLVRTAPFFVKRFGTMVWTIFTPDGVAHWDRKRISFFDADDSLALPAEDAAEALWLTYYESIFNPARLNVSMMRKEMPVSYWKNLPEAQRIPSLIAGAAQRAGQMVATTLEREVAPYRGSVRTSASVEPQRPASATPPDKEALETCRRCTLGARATQAVPGEGPVTARLMLVGEQPGDEEDLAGKPFVGPAGRLLRRALAEAGIDASAIYVTNAVKHFSYEPRGKRRIHKTPAQQEIAACEIWLEAEIESIEPVVIVALGASALTGVLHRRLKVGEARALELSHRGGARVRATYHPSAVLRAVDEERKADLYAMLVMDLRAAMELSADRPA